MHNIEDSANSLTLNGIFVDNNTLVLTQKISDHVTRINIYDWVAIGIRLATLNAFKENTPLWSLYDDGAKVITLLENLLELKEPEILISAKQPAKQLVDSLHAIFSPPGVDSIEELTELYGNKLTKQQEESIQYPANHFDLSFRSDLMRLHFYFIPQEGIYSLDVLLQSADKMYSPKILALLPKGTIENLNEFGKCYAYMLPTAASFHILRGTEMLVLDYVRLFHTGTLITLERARDWGSYVRLLRKTKADLRVISKIDEVRELHRNPIIHPRTEVTMVHANLLFSSCYGLIPAILADMEKQKTNPDPTIMQLLP
jgi:hypothetical protein